MNLLEIVDERDLKLKEIENITSKLKSEKRKMNESEDINFIKLKEDVENLNKKIDEIKESDKKSVRNSEVNKKNNEKNMNTFSLLKTIKDLAENRGLNEETIAILEAGKSEFAKANVESRGQLTLPLEYRADIMAGIATQGLETVPTVVYPLLTALRAKTVLGQAGATFYSKLIGNVQIPVYTGSNVDWSTETGTTTAGTGTFSDVTLSPHRLTTYIDISKQFLVQDSIGAEQSLMTDLINSILVTVEKAAFDANAASTSRPAGLFNGADLTGSLSGTTTYAKLVGIKGAVDTANALTGNLAYITNPAQAAVMETTPIDPNGGAVMAMSNGKVNGYPVYVTSNFGTSASENLIAFGNWADFVVGQ